MLKQILIAATLCGATSIAATAHADKKQDAVSALTRNVTQYLWAIDEKKWSDGPSSLERWRNLPSCTALIATARKAGVKDDDLIIIGGEHPKA